MEDIKMARVIISETLITSDFIEKGTFVKAIAASSIDIENVTRVTAGNNLIYIEYVGADNTNCVRAFGKNEFETLVISDDNLFAILPLKDEFFEKKTFRFKNPLD